MLACLILSQMSRLAGHSRAPVPIAGIQNVDPGILKQANPNVALLHQLMQELNDQHTMEL